MRSLLQQWFHLPFKLVWKRVLQAWQTTWVPRCSRHPWDLTGIEGYTLDRLQQAFSCSAWGGKGSMQACHLQQHLSQQKQQLQAPDASGQSWPTRLQQVPFIVSRPAWQAASQRLYALQVPGGSHPHLCHCQVHFQHDAVALSARLVKDVLPDCLTNPRQATCWGLCQELQGIMTTAYQP